VLLQKKHLKNPLKPLKNKENIMADELGFRQTYKQKGTITSGGGPAESIEKGASGSHRDNNWKKGAAQCKVTKGDKVGPYTNVKDQFGSKY
jgi:hypothetical protein